MFRLLSILSLSYMLLYASTTPLHVEVNIYKNISFMTKEYRLSGEKSISLRVPSQTELENINIETNRCKKESLKLSSPKSFKSEKEKRLKIKIVNLSDKILSMQEENNLLKTLPLKERGQKNLQEVLGFFRKNYSSNLKQISTLNQELNRAKKELQEAQNQKAKEYKTLSAIFTCRDNGTVSLKYPQYDFRVKSFYEITGHAKKGTLNFVKKIKIIQKSGEDFENIDIISHSNSYNQRVQPSPFFPKYLNMQKQKRVLYSKSSNEAMRNTLAIEPIAKVRYIQNLTTSAFVARKIKLLNNQEKIIALENQDYKVSFQNDIDGYSSSRAYLKASFKSDKYYQRGRAYISLGENRIGTINLKNIKKGTKVDIYFGENQNIYVKKNLLKRYSESEFFGNNQINTQVWRYTITNKNSSTQKINLIERIPVSQNEDIKVEPLFDTKKAKISKKGKVVWSFTLTPDETKMIKFGYKTIKPKK